MTKNIFSGLAAILVAVLAIMLAGAPVLAAELRQGDAVTVVEGEVVNDDLYVFADTVTIDGIVDGDLWAVGRVVTVNGTVTGSILAAGRTVNIDGAIARAVRLLGSEIDISGSVNGDLLVIGNELDISSAARAEGDLLLGAESARIGGYIGGDIRGGGGEITLADEVGGDVDLNVNSLTVTSKANIRGNLTYTSEKEADVQASAQISGIITHDLPEVDESSSGGGPLSGVWGKIIGFLMALVVGVVIILIAPKKVASVAESIHISPWPSFGWGAIILFATPIAVIVACITIIGIPVGIITLVLYGIAIYLAQVFVGLFIGQWIIGHFREVETKAALTGALAVGLMLLGLLRLIPYMGFIIGLATALFGLGALLVAGRRLRTEAVEVASS